MLLCRRVTSSFFISGFLPFIGDFLTGRSFSADTCRWQARAYVQVAGNGGSLNRWDPEARGLHCINGSSASKWRSICLSCSKLPVIGRAHVCTPVTNAHLVCSPLLDTKHTIQIH